MHRTIGLSVVTAALLLTADSVAEAQSSGRQKITMWFWGAPPEDQKAMRDVLINPYNKSQNKYTLTVEFRNTVDKDISVALAAGQGPDIVYGSGPAFIAPLAAAGKLEPLDKYSVQYNWKGRILAPIYQSALVKGKLYSLPNSLNTLGIFYNKKVLARNGWKVPTTLAELTTIMDAAKAKGLYPSVTGNKGWQPVNLNYANIFLTHVAGPDKVYGALTGKVAWTDPAIVRAVQMSADWYKKGYLGGNDYTSLNFNDAVQLLADGRSPFFIGPTIVFQFANQFFTGDKANDLGFFPFPRVSADQKYPIFTLGTTATLSVNANSKNKDAAAAVINRMMTPEFALEMTKRWPGYWGVPLKTFNPNTAGMSPLSAAFVKVMHDTINAIGTGHFGYAAETFFPPATQQDFVNIDTVWQGTTSATGMLQRAEADFKREQAAGLVPPAPAPSR